MATNQLHDAEIVAAVQGAALTMLRDVLQGGTSQTYLILTPYFHTLHLANTSYTSIPRLPRKPYLSMARVSCRKSWGLWTGRSDESPRS